MREVLKAENLHKSYGRKRVVNGVSLEVGRGEVVGLLGPNGAGKTTSFHLIVGLMAPDDGAIYLDGEAITRFPMHMRARKGIGYLTQEASVFRRLTVEDNLMAILETMPMKKAERLSRGDFLLEELGIAHLRKQMAFSLSGGERRRVEIARALATSPSFLLLDEPFTGIDPKSVTDLQEIIIGLKAKNYGILITDHNVRETLRITDRSYLISEGKVLLSGSAEELTNSPEARRVYLGEKFNP